MPRYSMVKNSRLKVNHVTRRIVCHLNSCCCSILNHHRMSKRKFSLVWLLITSECSGNSEFRMMLSRRIQPENANTVVPESISRHNTLSAKKHASKTVFHNQLSMNILTYSLWLDSAKGNTLKQLIGNTLPATGSASASGR